MKALRALFRRLTPLLVLTAAVLLVAPSFEAHAYAAPSDAPSSAAASSISTDGDCDDCAFACAGGCCHLSHIAIRAEPFVESGARPSRVAQTWRHVRAAPDAPPSGPDRPPRS